MKFWISCFQWLAGFCGKLKGTPLCKKCELKLKKYEIEEIKYYLDDKNIPFDYAIHALKYDDEIRNRLIQYKFKEKSYLFQMFAKFILKNPKIYRFLKNYDIIVPVPISKKKYNKRGYNQTELIARTIAKELDIKLSKNNLVKIRETAVQSTLSLKERKENIKNAFLIKNENEFEGKNIILFDDIYTSGSTAFECSKIIKKANPKSILVLTVAKD